jgi:hypothetical protein
VRPAQEIAQRLQPRSRHAQNRRRSRVALVLDDDPIVVRCGVQRPLATLATLASAPLQKCRECLYLTLRQGNAQLAAPEEDGRRSPFGIVAVTHADSDDDSGNLANQLVVVIAHAKTVRPRPAESYRGVMPYLDDVLLATRLKADERGAATADVADLLTAIAAARLGQTSLRRQAAARFAPELVSAVELALEAALALEAKELSEAHLLAGCALLVATNEATPASILRGVSASPDTCPNCGTTVQATGARGLGSRGEGDELPRATEQSATCPNCGAGLSRNVGARWAVAPRRFTVWIIGGSYNTLVGALAPILRRGRSVTMAAEGLGPASFEVEVTAADEDAARAEVERLVTSHGATVDRVEPA